MAGRCQDCGKPNTPGGSKKGSPPLCDGCWYLRMWLGAESKYVTSRHLKALDLAKRGERLSIMGKMILSVSRRRRRA